MLLRFLKSYKTPLITSFIQYILTLFFQFDKLFFNYPYINYKNMIIIKLFYFVFLIIFWCFIFFVYRKIKENNEKYIRGFKIYIVYISIILFLLFFAWPGLWNCDDICILQDCFSYNFNSWQHFLSSFEYLIFLQFLPLPGGIILLQNLIIGLCVTFFVVTFENFYKIKLSNKFFDYFFKLIPFLLFPILRYQFSGYRMGLYIYIELVMFCLLIYMTKEKKNWNYDFLILFSIVSIIGITWRTESLIYFPCICLFLLFLKTLTIKKKLIIFLLIVNGVFGINFIQSNLIKNHNYEIVSTIRQCVPLVRKAYEQNEKELLNSVNKILKINIIIKNPEIVGEILYWDKNILRDNYTKKEYQEYLKAFFILCYKYPSTIIRERINTFKDTTGLYERCNVPYIYPISTLFSNDAKCNYYSPFFVNQKWILNKPLSKMSYKFFTSTICLEKNAQLYKIIWNIIPPIIAFFILGLYLLYKKLYYEFIIFSFFLIKFCVIFISAPAAWLMYYLSYYLIGYIVIFYSILYFIHKKEQV